MINQCSVCWIGWYNYQHEIVNWGYYSRILFLVSEQARILAVFYILLYPAHNIWGCKDQKIRATIILKWKISSDVIWTSYFIFGVLFLQNWMLFYLEEMVSLAHNVSFCALKLKLWARETLCFGKSLVVVNMFLCCVLVNWIVNL